MQSTPEIDRQRRRFLKVGLLGSAVLVAASGGLALRRQPGRCDACLWLHKGDQQFLQAVIPVMLAGALPDKDKQRIRALNEIIDGFDQTVAHFPPSIRAEIRQLLWLLQSPLTRPLLTGTWSSWKKSNAADVNEFLEAWKNSRLDLLRVGYTALHDLVAGAWYANPMSWQRIHYPGAPQLK